MAVFPTADGRNEEGAEQFHEILAFNPAMPLAQFALAAHHVSRGEWTRRCHSAKRSTPSRLYAQYHWNIRRGSKNCSGRSTRGLAVYHWVLREFDAEADWFEKAIDQRDPYAGLFLRTWYGRELRSTPRWAGLMRKLNLPES